MNNVENQLIEQLGWLFCEIQKSNFVGFYVILFLNFIFLIH